MESTDSRDRLDTALKGLKVRKKEYLLLKGSSIMVISIFVSLGLSTLLSVLFSNPIYYTFLKIAAVLSLILVVIRTLVIPLLTETGTRSVLGELDKVAAGLGEDTLNALQLKDNNINNSKILGTSKSLALAHIDEITNKVETLDLTSLFPIRNLKKYLIPAVAGAIFASAVLILV